MRPSEAAGWLDDLLGRDPAAALSRCAAEVVWEVPGPAHFGGGTHRGPGELTAFFALVTQLFPAGLRASGVRAWGGDRSASIEATLDGETAGGRSYSNNYVFVLDTDETDRIVRVREYTDTAKAEAMLATTPSLERD